VIVRVAFNLDRESELVTSYGALMSELSDIPENKRTHRDVSDAVIRIRRSKLPDPDVLGNAGSFFKNPIVSTSDFNELQATHSDIPHYPQENGDVKLAAGWLIDSAGWKGHDRGTHGVHELQALVLVNKGGASGEEVWSLAKEIMASVEEKFGVRLHPEVNQIGL
jgi:UDP-N-acetylmuramate dehydrogenase